MNQPCIICGANTSPLHHPRMKVTYHACGACEFISLDPRDRITEAEEFRIYENHQNSIEDPRYVAFFERFLQNAVFPYASGGRQGFDFGSGPSPVLAQLLERDYSYQMDIYDYFYSPEKGFEGKEYDLITTTEVVEHLADPLPTFRLLAGLLKPDGILAVMTLFHHRDPAHFLEWHYVRDKSHISFYTPATMVHVAQQVGLQMVHTNEERFSTFARK